MYAFDTFSVVSSIRSFSFSCLANALITRTPLKFSLSTCPSSSILVWAALYSGTVLFIIIAITNINTGIKIAKIKDILGSIYIDIINAPTHRNGALLTSLINIATANTTWFTSFVILLISVEFPNLSISEYENNDIFLNKPFLMSFPTLWHV